jgi:hypothetical protein
MDRDQALQMKCLTLISRIAARGAMHPDPGRVYDTLMELCFTLRRRLRGRDLERMHHDLDWIDVTSPPSDPLEALKFEVRSTWN